MLVRDADATRDAAACAAIYAPYVSDTPISMEVQVPDARELAVRIERISLTHPWLVAQIDDEVVGFAYGSRHRERAAYRWAADVTVYVSPPAQRQGVGRALYEALLGQLPRQGLTAACAGITLPNEASVGLHEALGFRAVGTFERIGFKLGRWWDVGWWQLDLPASPGRTPTEPGPPARIEDR